MSALARARAFAVVDEWERVEQINVRAGHRSTLEQLIAGAILEAEQGSAPVLFFVLSLFVAAVLGGAATFLVVAL